MPRKKKPTGKEKSDLKLPPGAVLADHNELQHNNTYSPLPLFYVDKPFVCKDCGKKEIWSSTQQKWWYEVAKGHIDSIAVRCRDCRKKFKNKENSGKKIG